MSRTLRALFLQAKTQLLHEQHNIILLAETHKHLKQTLQMIQFFKKHGWDATASPARPSERSPLGNTAGVVVAVSNHADNRPVSFCTNPEGTLTSNAQLTGRLVVLDWVEVLVLAGYLECGLGFAGSNQAFVTDLELTTRGGKHPFILGLDANRQKKNGTTTYGAR